MFWTKKYKEYPLLVKGNYIDGFQYALFIYSGEYKLPMLIDSGAQLCQISSTALKGCQYYDTGQKDRTQGLGGIISSKRIFLEFNLEETQGDTYQFGLDTNVLDQKDNNYFSSEGLCGILGSNFLRFCDVDFRKGVIKVFNTPF